MKLPAAALALVLGLLPAAVVAGGVTLGGPESIEFHARLNRTVISNTDNGDLVARAADGSLSLFSAAPFTPFGIELLAGTLFVVDSGSLKGYDIDTAAPVVDFPLAGAGFLNGITSNGVDTVYVSDFGNNTITAIDVSDLSAPVADTPVSTGSATPNGLVFDRINQRLIIATWGASANVLSLALTPGATPTTLIDTNLSNIDGIALDCRGALFVAAWGGCTSGGCLRRFDPPLGLNSPAQVVVDGLSNPADIDYDWVSADIAVPQSGNNSVSFHPGGCEAAVFASDFER
jgi:hypothetical protein